LVEQKQWMVTGAGIVAIPDAHLLVGLTLESMSSTTPRGGRQAWTRSIHRPERSASAARFFSAASHRTRLRTLHVNPLALQLDIGHWIVMTSPQDPIASCRPEPRQ
jgi:hypothetical protein